MLFVHWMERMVGVWKSLTTRVVEAVAVGVVDVALAEVRTPSVMSVGSQVILPESVARALVQEAWEVDGIGAPVLGGVGAPVMGEGATAPGIDLCAAAASRLLDVTAASHLLDVTAAIAVPLRSAVLLVIPLMPMGIKAASW